MELEIKDFYPDHEGGTLTITGPAVNTPESFNWHGRMLSVEQSDLGKGVLVFFPGVSAEELVRLGVGK